MFNRSNGGYQPQPAAPAPRRIDDAGLVPPHQGSAAMRAPVPPLEERHAPPHHEGQAVETGPPLAEAEDGFSREIQLSRTYQAHGEPLTRLRFRKPATRDIRAIGNPFRMHIKPLPNGDAVIENVDVDYDKLAKIVHVLAIPPIPPSTVDSFDLIDLDECGEALLSAFFMTRSTFKVSR